MSPGCCSASCASSIVAPSYFVPSILRASHSEPLELAPDTSTRDPARPVNDQIAPMRRHRVWERADLVTASAVTPDTSPSEVVRPGGCLCFRGACVAEAEEEALRQLWSALRAVSVSHEPTGV